MEPKSLLFVWSGFFIGSFTTAGLVALEVRSDPFLVIMAFSLGVIVCLGFTLVFPHPATHKSPPEDKQRKSDDWWQNGEPPPWDSYRHKDDDMA